jgi:hypothetical protein
VTLCKYVMLGNNLVCHCHAPTSRGVAIPAPTEIGLFPSAPRNDPVEIAKPVPKLKRGISFLTMAKGGVTNHMNEYKGLTVRGCF